jgi:hypothetical protein
MDLMDRRRALLMASNKTILEGEFALYDVINVTEYKYYGVAEDFDNEYLTGLLNRYNNVTVFVDFIDNTNNSRAAIWHSITKIAKYNLKSSDGRRVGGPFSASYGADIYPGAKIYIYYSVLNLES